MNSPQTPAAATSGEAPVAAGNLVPTIVAGYPWLLAGAR